MALLLRKSLTPPLICSMWIKKVSILWIGADGCNCRAIRRRAGRLGRCGRGDQRRKRHIEDVIEPYLIQQGYLVRTPRGRVAAPKCFLHLGLDVPERSDSLAHENRQQQIPNLPE